MTSDWITSKICDSIRYTIGNSMSLGNVALHWLTSEYMQLECGFMQLPAAVHRRNIVDFNCLFEGKMLLVQ